MLNRDELIALVETVSPRRGWDFSSVRDDRAPVPWNYEEVVRRYLSPDDTVLDIGTGGGERFLSLSDAYHRGLGVDPAPDMLRVARENAAALSIEHVSFAAMSAERLELDADTFDVVLNRHANLCAAEVMRVLRPGGVFITQQVGARNLGNICALFGCGPGGEYDPPQPPIATIADEFRRLGGRVLCTAEYDVDYDFLDVQSLLFLLQGVGIPTDFDITRHWPQVVEIITRYAGPGDDVGIAGAGDSGYTGVTRIRSNEHRELLIVKKEG